MSPLPQTPSGNDLVERCERAGFALAGVIDASPSEFEDEFRAWIDTGKQGEMEWLAENAEKRLDPAKMVEGARTIVMVADLYAKKPSVTLPAGHGRVAKYAQGDNYHAIIKKRLHEICDELHERFPDETFRAFVDTAPVLEREHAARAGIGWTGKHTLTINPTLGSDFFIGGILSTKRFTPSVRTDRWDPARDIPETGHCGTCTRCIDACPTDAITPWSVDARRCISYLTIEHRSPIDPAFWSAIGDNLYGCDICQEVCPHNAETDAGANIHEAYTPRHSSFDLLEILGWTEEDRRRAFVRSAMKRAKLSMMKRNAVICAHNAIESGEDRGAALRERIESLASDESENELARHTAREALRRFT